jgi:hypothetical protein
VVESNRLQSGEPVKVSVESAKRAPVAGHGLLGRSGKTLLWYADAGRKAKKEVVGYMLFLWLAPGVLGGHV